MTSYLPILDGLATTGVHATELGPAVSLLGVGPNLGIHPSPLRAVGQRPHRKQCPPQEGRFVHGSTGCGIARRYFPTK